MSQAVGQLTAAPTTPPNGLAGALPASGQRRSSFSSLRIQFEQTLESLKQVYKSTQQFGDGQAPAMGPEETPLGASGQCPVDSRSLLLVVGE